MKKRVLITGASGFVGRHCVEALLRRGYEVHAVSSREMTNSDQVHWHQADLLRSTSLTELMETAKPDVLVHLAWYVAPGKWYSAPENFAWLQASMELLRQFQLAGGSRVLMVGSGTEYDWSYGYCVNGKTPLDPSTYYGKCKRILSEALLEFSENTGIQSTWARLFFLYGPHEAETRLIASAITNLLKQQTANFTHGNQVRDFMHVGDAADAIAFITDSDHSGSINVATGQPITLKQLVNIVADKLNAHEFLNFGAIEAPPTDLPFVVADIEPLQNLGWRASFTSESGIENSINWWKAHLRMKDNSI